MGSLPSSLDLEHKLYSIFWSFKHISLGSLSAHVLTILPPGGIITNTVTLRTSSTSFPPHHAPSCLCRLQKMSAKYMTHCYSLKLNSFYFKVWHFPPNSINVWKASPHLPPIVKSNSYTDFFKSTPNLTQQLNDTNWRSHLQFYVTLTPQVSPVYL